MSKNLITESTSITLFIIGGALILAYAEWQLALGIIAFISSAKIDVIYRIRKDYDTN